jgi:predicted nuclease of restriction endonuclease-like RecB superfamily
LRFSLQDIPKHISRRGGELTIALNFLRPGESHDEIDQLIAYHEQALGQPQRAFNIDDARAIVGDYRLAHCLLAALSAWYTWRSPAWDEVTQRMGGDAALSALFEAGITSPVQLRLALFDYVNAHHGGFLGEQTRAHDLEAFAAQFGLTVTDLDYLLALDTDEEAILVRQSQRPPTPDEVALLYNQWAFESALFNASEAHFIIDCDAFLKTDQSLPASTPATGVGAAIKRLCYLARKLGVYYDLSYQQHITHSPYLHLTLYGPQDMTGTPQQYGTRLARLCRLLLGYCTPLRAPKQTKLPTAAIVQADATVHFLQRTYRFEMTSDLLSLLPPNVMPRHAHDSFAAGDAGDASVPSPLRPAPAPTERADAAGDAGDASVPSPLRPAPAPTERADAAGDAGDASVPSPLRPSPAPTERADAAGDAGDASVPSPLRPAPAPTERAEVYDSGIEQSFAEAFASLARSHAADGWQLEREPEPLLLPSGGAASQAIFIPDFALARDHHRIYLEILGFWTPSYRERKLQKLQQLKGRQDIVLAIPVEASGAFASLSSDFPQVIYDGQLSATEVLQVLRAHVDDFAQRLAELDPQQVRRRITASGWLPERASFAALHCYRRSEIAQAAELIADDTIHYLPVIGFYDRNWLEHIGVSFVQWLEERYAPMAHPRRGGGGAERSGDACVARVPDELAPTSGPGDNQESVTLAEALQICRARWPELAQGEDAALEALLGLIPGVRILRSSIFEAIVELQGTSDELPDAHVMQAQLTPSKKVVRERRTVYKKRPAGTSDNPIAEQQDLWG